jgi:peptidoglycan hydrolase-like protein with peptidoglycan-binding domain|tara:strand:+ start:6363 stop:7568 length:1206 start_codon:yes stop_codon:yes gene_type:complete
MQQIKDRLKSRGFMANLGQEDPPAEMGGVPLGRVRASTQEAGAVSQGFLNTFNRLSQAAGAAIVKAGTPVEEAVTGFVESKIEESKAVPDMIRALPGKARSTYDQVRTDIANLPEMLADQVKGVGRIAGSKEVGLLLEAAKEGASNVKDTVDRFGETIATTPWRQDFKENVVPGAVNLAKELLGSFNRTDRRAFEHPLGDPAPENQMGSNPMTDEGNRMRLQMKLNDDHGENLVVDGIIGPKTQAAIKRFQANNGLNPDGNAGIRTLTALGLNTSPVRDTPVHQTPSVATQAERTYRQTGRNAELDLLLGPSREHPAVVRTRAKSMSSRPDVKLEGLYRRGAPQSEDVSHIQRRLNQAGARLKVDGIFGSNTAEEVRNYQQRNGLKVDGIVGPETLAHLGL